MRMLATCRDVADLVTDYLEGELDQGDRLAFERHVVLCPPCRGYLSQMRDTLRIAGEPREAEALSETAQAQLLAAFRDWRGRA